MTHLQQVHSPLITAGTDLRFMWNKMWSFANHEWSAAWEPLSAPDAHIGQLRLTHKMSILGCKFPLLDMEVTAQQVCHLMIFLQRFIYC